MLIFLKGKISEKNSLTISVKVSSFTGTHQELIFGHFMPKFILKIEKKIIRKKSKINKIFCPHSPDSRKY